MKKIFALLVFLLAVQTAPPVLAQDNADPAAVPPPPQMDLPRTSLTVDGHKIEVQIARTEAQLETGLMSRTSMPKNEGMIFVFPKAATQCFWMRNTVMPLSVAFIANDGSIINLDEMQALSDAQHCSKKPAQFVLEMNQGWFSAAHIQAGSKIHGSVFGKTAKEEKAKE